MPTKDILLNTRNWGKPARPTGHDLTGDAIRERLRACKENLHVALLVGAAMRCCVCPVFKPTPRPFVVVESSWPTPFADDAELSW
jgi:hypothetical protein